MESSGFHAVLDTARAAITKLLGLLSITLFAALVAATSWQVFSRQVLHAPSTWSEELSKLLFVFLSFVGAAFVFGERGHIAVDFLVRRAPRSSHRFFGAFVQIVILFFALVGMLWGGILAANTAWNQNLTALPLTIGWVYLIIPITGVAIAVFALGDLLDVLTGRVRPYEEEVA